MSGRYSIYVYVHHDISPFEAKKKKEEERSTRIHIMSMSNSLISCTPNKAFFSSPGLKYTHPRLTNKQTQTKIKNPSQVSELCQYTVVCSAHNKHKISKGVLWESYTHEVTASVCPHSGHRRGYNSCSKNKSLRKICLPCAERPCMDWRLWVHQSVCCILINLQFTSPHDGFCWFPRKLSKGTRFRFLNFYLAPPPPHPSPIIKPH